MRVVSLLKPGAERGYLLLVRQRANLADPIDWNLVRQWGSYFERRTRLAIIKNLWACGLVILFVEEEMQAEFLCQMASKLGFPVEPFVVGPSRQAAKARKARANRQASSSSGGRMLAFRAREEDKK